VLDYSRVEQSQGVQILGTNRISALHRFVHRKLKEPQQPPTITVGVNRTMRAHTRFLKSLIYETTFLGSGLVGGPCERQTKTLVTRKPCNKDLVHILAVVKEADSATRPRSVRLEGLRMCLFYMSACGGCRNPSVCMIY
jgi:hypothetical protein